MLGLKSDDGDESGIRRLCFELFCEVFELVLFSYWSLW